jgi:hypothetical protein
MFRLPLHPSPVGLVFGVLVVAFWALLWGLALAQLVYGPASERRPPRLAPGVARPLPVVEAEI